MTDWNKAACRNWRNWEPASYGIPGKPRTGSPPHKKIATLIAYDQLQACKTCPIFDGCKEQADTLRSVGLVAGTWTVVIDAAPIATLDTLESITDEDLAWWRKNYPDKCSTQ